MPTLNAVFDSAKRALMANQKAISTTSHNIANANTPGYTRQRTVLETTNPLMFGGQFFGTGVDVAAVERVYDSFQTMQLREATSSLSRFEAKGQHLTAIESILNDFDGAGLSARLDAFFNSASDVAANPSSYGERAAMLSSANVLSDTFNLAAADLSRTLSSINTDISHKAAEVNGLATRIAGLNGQIASVEMTGNAANDLRDKRDMLLEELSGLVDIGVSENDNGQIDVYVGGSFIVAGVSTSALTVEASASDPDIPSLRLNGGRMNDRISGGSLRGDLDGIGYLVDLREKVDFLSASITKEVNILHAQGYGLDGSTGQDFFSPFTVYTSANIANTGGAVIAGGAVTDMSALTLDDYEVRFSGTGTYNVVNLGTDMVVSSGAYTSGSPIVFDGLSVTITNSPKTPQGGDRFLVSSTRNAAANMGVEITDPKKIAASGTLAGIPGDNTNALAIEGLRDANTIENTSFAKYYNRLVTDLGTATNDARVNYDAQSRFTQELRASKEAVSGVSMEEEAINLVKLQRAYEAAAKVMSTVDQMLETLLNIR